EYVGSYPLSKVTLLSCLDRRIASQAQSVFLSQHPRSQTLSQPCMALQTSCTLRKRLTSVCLS
ncbi:hypothetical protein D018_0216B, partial [Vibrio parahaemolyticus VP2007-007]